MTQAEKAKAYDEALEKARQLCDYPTTKPFISDLQNLFPELKESEDERIRKELIEFVKHRGGFKQEYIAWLEKQAEQKSIWNEEDEHRIKLLEALCEDKLFESVPNSTMYGEMRKTIDWLNFLRPQSKQEWNEEDERTIKEIDEIIYECPYCESKEKISNWLNSLKQKICG